MKEGQKIALVTGASRGIGAAIFAHLAQAGFYVIGTGTTQASVEQIDLLCQSQGLSGKGLVLNLSDGKGIEVFLETLRNLALMPDVLVNNAGVTRDNLLMRMSDEEWDTVLETNLTGVFRLCKALIRPMMRKRWGRVINIGSVVGTTGNPGQANYCAAKAGLEGFSKALACEVATRGITVNVVAPGFIQTDMTSGLNEQWKAQLLSRIPMQRIGSPEDIAHAVSFLASEGAGYMTGCTLHINGGMLMP